MIIIDIFAIEGRKETLARQDLVASCKSSQQHSFFE
jgi:hypothetical protein